MKLEPSEIFKVLAVETRVKIIDLLKSKGPLGAKNISDNWASPLLPSRNI